MKIIASFFLLVFLFSCSSTDTQVHPKKEKEKKVNDLNQPLEILKGEALFQAILDTLKTEKLTAKILQDNNWVFQPFEDCISYYEFHRDMTGIDYGCEQAFEYEINYKLDRDTLLINVFNENDEPGNSAKKTMHRSDKYVFNGSELIMVGSKIYTGDDKAYVPEIEVLIRYKMQKDKAN